MNNCLLKICFLFLVSILFSISAMAQTAVDKYLTSWAENDQFSIVNISPKMFEMMSSMDNESLDTDTKSLLESLQQLKTIEYQGAESKDHHRTAKKALLDHGFEELLQLQDKGFDINILARNIQGNFVSELVTIKSNKETMYLSNMLGDIDLTKVSKLSKSLNAPGMEHLKDINK